MICVRIVGSGSRRIQTDIANKKCNIRGNIYGKFIELFRIRVIIFIKAKVP